MAKYKRPGFAHSAWRYQRQEIGSQPGPNDIYLDDDDWRGWVETYNGARGRILESGEKEAKKVDKDGVAL